MLLEGQITPSWWGWMRLCVSLARSLPSERVFCSRRNGLRCLAVNIRIFCTVDTPKLIHLPSLFQNAIKMTIRVTKVVLTYVLLQHGSLWHHMAGTQLIICGTDQFWSMFVWPMCVMSHDWDSINYLWDWPFLLAFVRRLKIHGQSPAPGKFRSYN